MTMSRLSTPTSALLRTLPPRRLPTATKQVYKRSCIIPLGCISLVYRLLRDRVATRLSQLRDAVGRKCGSFQGTSWGLIFFSSSILVCLFLS